MRLRKKPTLSLGELHGCGALLVVVRDVIDPRAHGIATHQPGVAGPQQLGRRAHILHTRIEPQIVAVWIKDHWHAVVN